ncbi:hypothetical protein B0H16DRAFT_1479807 [Mycena metata]|uniref:Uncharacterized protein n=1 Tax=Mycena metata TaxID=1033252 RepID=A0AAD7H493_9AGAR|nr:hypothetical protein B0H16DRAFT_1479807 [Mycena metata]
MRRRFDRRASARSNTVAGRAGGAGIINSIKEAATKFGTVSVRTHSGARILEHQTVSSHQYIKKYRRYRVRTHLGAYILSNQTIKNIKLSRTRELPKPQFGRLFYGKKPIFSPKPARSDLLSHIAFHYILSSISRVQIDKLLSNGPTSWRCADKIIVADDIDRAFGEHKVWHLVIGQISSPAPGVLSRDPGIIHLPLSDEMGCLGQFTSDPINCQPSPFAPIPAAHAFKLRFPACVSVYPSGDLKASTLNPARAPGHVGVSLQHAPSGVSTVHFPKAFAMLQILDRRNLELTANSATQSCTTTGHAHGTLLACRSIDDFRFSVSHPTISTA